MPDTTPPHATQRTEPPPAGARATHFSVRLAVFYGAMFLIYGVHLPYLPVWLDWRGLSPSEIALVTAIPFFLRLVVTPVVAMIADEKNAHRSAIAVLSAIAVAASLLLSQSSGFWLILAGAVALSLTMTTMMPLTETIAVSGVKARGLDYGRMRLWGSLTFIAANLIGGAVIAANGAATGIYMIIAAAIATAAASWFLPDADHTPLARHSNALQTAQPNPSGQRISRPMRFVRLADAWALVKNPAFVALLVATGCVQAAHATYYTFGTLHWLGQGIDAKTTGLLWAIGVLAEVALFAFSGRAVRAVGPAGLLIAGCAAAAIRWTAMSFEPGLWALIPLQLLHGLTYGAAHLGAIHLIAQTVPDKSAGTAQALYATIGTGAAMGAATLLSGWLYGAYGADAYLAMTALSLIGLAAALAIKRLTPLASANGSQSDTRTDNRNKTRR